MLNVLNFPLKWLSHSCKYTVKLTDKSVCIKGELRVGAAVTWLVLRGRRIAKIILVLPLTFFYVCVVKAIWPTKLIGSVTNLSKSSKISPQTWSCDTSAARKTVFSPPSGAGHHPSYVNYDVILHNSVHFRHSLEFVQD